MDLSSETPFVLMRSKEGDNGMTNSDVGLLRIANRLCEKKKKNVGLSQLLYSLDRSSRKFRNSRVHPSALPPVHLVQTPHDKNMITPGRCFTVLNSSLPPTIVKLFISCTNPSSNLNAHLSQGKVQAIPPQGPACILLESFNATPYRTSFNITYG